jgi:hypothetical protein
MNRPTMTPKFCGEKAEDHIHRYLVEVGAYGDADKVVKALEMLLSKTALGFGMLAGQTAMMDLLLRTTYHAANALEGMGIKPEAGVKPQ